ncbi:hypothetical protein PRUPE_1G131300 [Prunus persica]|uniref:Uncharacterized protein n=1 Tax=Prunus persica TaxID=3760 RepID=A0A251QWS8_PRUPE|nr:hypothetical protein PRUPE_1G131300 [Prunus persica]
MANYQGFMTTREDKVFYHIRHPYPVLYDHVYPAEEVSYFPAQVSEFQHIIENSTKTATVKTVEVPAQKPHQIKGGVLTSTEARKIYGPVKTMEVSIT